MFQKYIYDKDTSLFYLQIILDEDTTYTGLIQINILYHITRHRTTSDNWTLDFHQQATGLSHLFI